MSTKPDFIVDPDGNTRDVRHLKYSQKFHSSSSQKSGTGSSIPDINTPRYSQSTPNTNKTPGIVIIPIGLILSLIFALLRMCSDPGTRNMYSESAASQLRRGLGYYNEGEYDRAILEFNVVIASEPDPGEAYNNLGLAYQAKGENNRAIAEFNNAIQRMPNPATPYSNRGGVYLDMGDYDQALADFNKAIELNPRLSKAYYNRGLTFLGLDNYDNAIDDFDKAIELTPKEIVVLEVTMEAMMPTGEPSFRRDFMKYSEGTESYPDLSQSYASRAIAYFYKGNQERANADLEKAMELGLDPGVALEIELLFTALAIEPQADHTEWIATPEENPIDENKSYEHWIGTGLKGKSISTLAIDPVRPSTLYAGTDEGVFKSKDGGESWIATDLSGTSVSSLAIAPVSPAALYAGTDGGMFKSTNDGENWDRADLGTVTTLVIDPVTPTTLYAGTYRGVFKSTNSGENWSVVITSMENDPTGFNVPVSLLAVGPEIPTTLYAGIQAYVHPQTRRYYPGSIFKSTNNRESWSKLVSDYNKFYVLVIDPEDPNVLYVGKEGGVQKSMDGGKTWSVINAGLTCSTVYDLAIDPTMPTTLYIGTNCGLLKSTNSGKNWNIIGLSGTNINSLTIDSKLPPTIYAGTDDGVFVIHQSDEDF